MLLKFDSFDHPGAANLAKSTNFGHFENFTQIWNLLTTPILQNMKFGKIKQFDKHWKFCSNLRFLTTQSCKPWNMAKSKKFSLLIQNLTKKMKFLTTQVLWIIKTWQNQ